MPGTIDDPEGHAPSERTSLLRHIIPTHVAPEGESNRSGFHPKHFAQVAWRSGSNVGKYVNILWLIVPIAFIMHFAAPKHPLVVFILAYIAMIPVANLLGFAGQEYARKMPKVSGILIETAFGSIVEIILFITLIAKHKTGHGGGSSEHGNLIPVIQAAILGSILTNLLLCLGACFLVGGWDKRHAQKFHASISEAGTGMLCVAGFGLLIPSAYFSALKGSVVPAMAGHHRFTKELLEYNTMRISQVTSILLIVAFVIYIYYNATTNYSIFDTVLEQDEHRDRDRLHDHLKPKFTFTECIVALIFSIVLVTMLAFFLVVRIEDLVEFGVPDQFLGLILLPLVEKAAEHLTAIDEAWDDQMNFALFHCIAPSLQTALFNGPLVVLVGWAMGKEMELNFEIFMVVLLVLAILVVSNFLRDGESNWHEGALLIVLYLIIAVAAWYYPNPDVATSNGSVGGHGST